MAVQVRAEKAEADLQRMREALERLKAVLPNASYGAFSLDDRLRGAHGIIAQALEDKGS